MSVCVFVLRVGDIFFHSLRYCSSTCEESVFLVLEIQSEPEMNIFALAEFTFFWGEGNNKK